MRPVSTISKKRAKSPAACPSRSGIGVTREDATKLDSWWEDRRSIIQPSEFILDENGTVLTSTYSSGPIGRMQAVNAVKLITLYESRK